MEVAADASHTCTPSGGPQHTQTGSLLEDQRSEDVTEAESHQVLIKDSVLCTNTTTFIVKGCKGQGVYGQVAHCIEETTNTPVAIKMFASANVCFDIAAKEYFILGMLSKINPDEYNLIRLYETVVYDHKPCLVFELLDRSLGDFIDTFSILPLSHIRPIAQQLLVALAGIKSLGIVHTDVNPDNVMLVNHRDLPFKVKLIDFGMARHAKIIKPGVSLQQELFRAPEVILGLQVTEAIDMWSLGCVLVYLYLGFVPFPGSTEYDVMHYIIDTLGMPHVSILDKGLKTKEFFDWNATKHCWTLKTPQDYEARTGVKVEGSSFFFSSLDDIIKMRSVIDNTSEEVQDGLDELEEESAVGPKQAWKTKACPSHDIVLYSDGEAFISLLEQIFVVDPERRITPEAALRHPFITMDHLFDFRESSPHVHQSCLAMEVCTPLPRDLHTKSPSHCNISEESTTMSKVRKFLSRVM